MKNFSRKLWWSFALLLIPCISSAQADITISLKNGGVVSYNIAESGCLLFKKDTMKIRTDASKDLMPIALSTVQKMEFSTPGTTGAEGALSTSQFKAFPNPVVNYLYLFGVENGEMVQIYSSAGVLIRESAYSASGLNLSDLSVGTYVVKVNGVSIKISKK